MHLTVALPGLFWPDLGDIDYLYSQLKLEHFNHLIKQAKLRVLDYGYSDLVYAAINQNTTDINQSNIQLAHSTAKTLTDSSLSLAKQMAIKLAVMDEFTDFLIAEPTHLRVDRDRLLISEAELLQLDASEARDIIQLINQHFAGEIKLYYLTDTLWLIGLNLNRANNKFYSILDIIGENINEYLPDGENAIHYNKLLNEIQMLLFNLKINKLRQEKGLLAVNSLWLWDKEICPQICQAYTQIVANNLASTINHVKIHPLADKIESVFANNSLIIIDSLYYPCHYRDNHMWLNKLENLELTLAHVLRQWLDNKKITTLDIMVPLLNKTLQLRVLRQNKLWRSWKFLQSGNNLIALAKDWHAA